MFAKLALVLGLVLLAPASAFAQAAQATPNQSVFPQTVNRGILQFCATGVTGCANTTAATYVTLYTAGSKGSICKALWMTNNDGSATHLITIAIKNSTTTTPLVALTSVSSAGTVSGTAPQNFMSTTLMPGLPLDPNANQYFYLINGDTLVAQFATAFTASDFLEIFVVCSDFN